jgi:hypothetical protein
MSENKFMNKMMRTKGRVLRISIDQTKGLIASKRKAMGKATSIQQERFETEASVRTWRENVVIVRMLSKRREHDKNVTDLLRRKIVDAFVSAHKCRSRIEPEAFLIKASYFLNQHLGSTEGRVGRSEKDFGIFLETLLKDKMVFKSFWLGRWQFDMVVPDVITKRGLRGAVVEIDGPCHQYRAKDNKDSLKEEFLKEIGVVVVRHLLKDQNKSDFARVAKTINGMATLGKKSMRRLCFRWANETAGAILTYYRHLPGAENLLLEYTGLRFEHLKFLRRDLRRRGLLRIKRDRFAGLEIERRAYNVQK